MSETQASLFFNQDQFKLIIWYKKINRILFKHGIFAVLALGAIGVVYALMHYAPQISHSNQRSETHSSATNEKLLRTLQTSQTKSTYLDITIPLGESSLKNNIIFSNQNLAFYQGVIIPKDFFIPKDTSLIDKESFEEGNASYSDIERLTRLLVFNPASATKELTEHPTYKLQKGILTDFNLNCINAPKFSDSICFSYLSKLYEEGRFYNLYDYPEDLKILSTKLTNNTQFCDLLYTTTLYQKTIFPAFKDAIMQCPNQIQQKYKLLTEFITITNELETNSFTNTTYTDTNLNMYKLLSAMQTLYRQISRSSYDKTLITPLLEFEQALLLKEDETPQTIFPSLYKDIIYRFNNHYFLPIIQTATSSLSQADKNQISHLVQEINNGNSVLGRIGLEKQVTTKALIEEKTHDAADIIQSQTYRISTLLPQLFQDQRLRIGRYTVAPDEQTVDISATITSQSITKALNTDLVASFTLHIEDREMLYVDKFYLANAPEFSSYLQTLLPNKTSFAQFLNVIDTQIALFSKSEGGERLTLCDKLSRNSNIKTLMLYCTDIEILVKKENIHYNFTLEDETLKSFAVSDSELYEEIQTKLMNTTITKSNTFSLINEIVNYVPDTQNNLCLTEEITIRNRMNIFLFETPSTIRSLDKECETFLINFQLQEINLRGVYHIETNTVEEIKYVIQKYEKERTFPITRAETGEPLTFPLQEEYRETLAYISNNAKSYLGLFNRQLFEEYRNIASARDREE